MTLATFISQLAQHCGVELTDESIQILEKDETITIALQLPENESGRFIGHHGDGLAAIQRITRLVFEEQYPDKRILININDYRERREAQLIEKTKSIVERVVQTGRSFTFQHYLPSHERFIIHTTLSTLPEADMVESISEGEGAYRRLTIRLK